jgi:hypothetical protein
MALDLWLILVAFLAGVLRVPVAILQLTGALAAPGPTWYVGFQGLLGVVQFAIGLVIAAPTCPDVAPRGSDAAKPSGCASCD